MPIAIKNDKADLSSEKQTEELALKFLNKLKPGNKLFLYGEMGVGKTTFVRYLINGFQKKNKLKLTEVTSPTFNLLSEYNIKCFSVSSVKKGVEELEKYNDHYVKIIFGSHYIAEEVYNATGKHFDTTNN